ncbi:MAG TPA: hypothetical protein VEZ71_09845 [Archangium sp.]|nr:hypothetical protein [Archangium sp.]
MATLYDFTTLAGAAARLKVSASAPELPGLIAAASRALANFLGYPAHLRESVEESVPSEGGRYLWLRSGALRRVVRAAVAGAELAANTYAVDDATQGRLVRRAGTWPHTGTWSPGIQSTPLVSHDTGEVVVTFDSGWRTPGQVELARVADPSSSLASDLPPELEEAVLLTLTAWHQRLGVDPDVTSMAMGGASLGWGADAMRGGKAALPLIAKLLARPHVKAHRRSAP